ncbi:MAG: hypothetical protein A2252_04555 [Elusimicrobia bacterium RIFOXYA2_FULL_39_19]|nr:MAG: hypothetical protein A2252_04555 [Elusimicrobia bacterium RIFOXYA2_FULL_39_19]
MTEIDMYLNQILQKYSARNLLGYLAALSQLETTLKDWAATCYVELLISGSLAKGTAISLASDVDYLVSLKSNCNENSGGLKSIYDSLYTQLNSKYSSVSKQNVSIRINLNGLEVDVTPARKQTGNTNDHWLYVSKLDTWKQTNIQRHINDISQSGRINEIKLLKIWRELNHLDFSSIYLEYLLINNILLNKSKDVNNLGDNVLHVLKELAKTAGNPLYSQVIDPANTANILSDLLTNVEKNKIIGQAQISIKQTNWNQIVW